MEYNYNIYKNWTTQNLKEFRYTLETKYEDYHAEDINFPDTFEAIHIQLKIDAVNEELKNRKYARV